jgi:capsular polysaccharide biosynthesis protein
MTGTKFVQERLIWPKVMQLRGHTLMGSASMAEANYYHWTLEVLPRLGAVLNSGFRWQDFDQFLIRNKGLRFQIESLQALGCPLSRVVQEVGSACFDCERLTTVTHPANYFPSEFAIHYLAGPFAEAVKAQKGAEKKASYPEKLYLSRLGNRRQLANESALTERLSEAGFAICDLGKCSLDEQIRLFEKARVIVGAHGAGFTNLVHCHAGTRVIEIFHPNHVETMYWGISAHKQLEYTPYCLASHEDKVSLTLLMKLLA